MTVKRGETTIGFTLDAKLDVKVREDVTVTGLTGAAGIYSFVHYQLADPKLSSVKVQLQDQIVKMVREKSFSQHVDPKSVDEILNSGSPAVRVLVFGLLQADGGLATVERLHQGISNSKSGNEQYHALLATQMHWSKFSQADKGKLRGYVGAAPYINDDRDRKGLAKEILATGR